MPGPFRFGGREATEQGDGEVDGQQSQGTLPPLDPFAGVPTDPAYQLSATDLLRPLIDPGSTSSLLRWRRQATNAPIVQVEDAYITGKLDLRAADLDYLFRFERCRFEYPPDVREASLLGLVFWKCWLPGLKARNLRSRNDVRLVRCVVQVESGQPGSMETTVRRGGDVDRGVPDAAVNLTDAAVEGSVILTRSAIHHPKGKAIQGDRLMVRGALLAYRLEAGGEVRIPGLTTGGNVNLSGATLHNPGGFALNGNGLHVGGSLLCEVDTYGPAGNRKRFTANGTVFLPSATVDSDIVLRGAKIGVDPDAPVVIEAWASGDPHVDPRPALVGDRLRVDGNLELTDATQVEGTLRMVNARIGGSLRLAGATVSVPRGERIPYYDRAMHLDGTEISGDFEATGIRVHGQLRMSDVSVRGNMHAWNARLAHHGRDVLSARRTKIAGNVDLSDAHVQGTLQLQGMDVGGSIDLFGAYLTAPAINEFRSFSLDLRIVNIGRDLMLTAHKDRVFYAEGGVNMDGATVARRVDLSGSILRSYPPKQVALDASDVTADEFRLRPRGVPEGRISLRRARCGTLTDNPELWQATGRIELEDFRYDALKSPIELADDDAVDRRIDMLRGAMDGYRPGPYDQLASMLRACGNEEHADTVLMRKQQVRYEALASGAPRYYGPVLRLWSWLQRWMVGYGYRPVRAVIWLIALLVGGTLWFGLGDDSCVNDPQRFQVNGERCVVNRDDSGLEWNPVLYTADLLVPIVDFGNKSRWYMADADKWVGSGLTVMGWVLATTVAAGVTRTLRRT